MAQKTAKQMDALEIDEFLESQQTGVLALANDGDAYAVPISFGYERGRAVFAYWQFGDESEKIAYSDATERACLAVYDIESQFDWRSALAFGTLHELTQKEWSELGELMDNNAWSPDLSVVGGRRLTVVGYEMQIEEATGLRRTSGTDGT